MSVAEPMKTEAVPAELHAAALALTPAQRENLAHDLILSLEDQERAPGYDEAWADELQRRHDRLVSGDAVTISAEEVFAKARAAIERRRAAR